jgi:hypothetical protein
MLQLLLDKNQWRGPIQNQTINRKLIGKGMQTIYPKKGIYIVAEFDCWTVIYIVAEFDC